jgi:hypothetical protein
MNLLDDAGWVKLSTTDTKKDNLWAIHPRIKEVYAGEIRTFNQIKHEELDTNFERNKSKQEFRAERQKSH